MIGYIAFRYSINTYYSNRHDTTEISLKVALNTIRQNHITLRVFEICTRLL
jgi:hypothetical protein